MLQVIIGRIIEQSRMELIEEDEMRELKEHKVGIVVYLKCKGLEGKGETSFSL